MSSCHVTLRNNTNINIQTYIYALVTRQISHEVVYKTDMSHCINEDHTRCFSVLNYFQYKNNVLHILGTGSILTLCQGLEYHLAALHPPLLTTFENYMPSLSKAMSTTGQTLL